jgi:hypothetical protein
MSQSSSDKYVYFTVGILKDSPALETLKQDALKHHMIDHPGQLIALRLTEYYEMMTRGIVQPVVRVPAIMTSAGELEEKESYSSSSTTAPHPVQSPHLIKQSLTPIPPSSAPTGSNPTFIGQLTGRMRALRREDSVISTSPTVDQNADEAADYWSTL